ncbi:Glutamyl-tRNA(Gln) amidotransferase subunit A, mitochondrial [Gryllus bimaculatus]|nr:Glutamyl-tRNA(Gln) amidotransferase subunit A, mitochondrial [Gryllus bimaculatus]
MAETKGSKEPPSTKQVVCRALSRVLLQAFIWIHQGFDYIVDIFCNWWYNESKRQIVPPVKDPLLLESAVSLAEKIRKKEVRSEEVVKCFIARIREVNPIINAVTDECFDEAIEEAQAVDAIVASRSEEELKREKPFLGVPFTTKDSTACKGVLHTLGIQARKDVRADEDSEVVARLKAAGGILLGVTNIPEINMWCESRNMLHGQTNNPYDTRRTVGGSSGGEACVIAACGSPLGIGSDIGGSIRLPCFTCGIFGHKPTTGLTPTRGLTLRTGEEGRTMVSAGPMSRYVQDLAPLLRVLIGEDKAVKELQLDDEVPLANLQVVYSDALGDIRASAMRPDMMEPLMRAVNHFQEISKLPVRKIHIKNMKYTFRLWHYWILKEPCDFSYELSNRKGRVDFWRELPLKLFGMSNFTLAAIVRLAMEAILPVEAPAWAEEKTNSMVKEITEILGENGVLLFPSSPMPAMHHYASFVRPYNFAYFAIFNVLNLPVTQVPMGLNAEGIPVGIQVVGAPNKDRLCLAVAKELQKAFGGYVPPFPV